MLELLLDALLDTGKLLPFLYVTYLAMEYLEHKLEGKTDRLMRKAGRFGPVYGGRMIGRVKRQSGSEATKRPVFPEQGNAVHYGRQPVEKYFFDVRFCICLLNNNLKIVLLHLKGGASP